MLRHALAAMILLAVPAVAVAAGSPPSRTASVEPGGTLPSLTLDTLDVASKTPKKATVVPQKQKRPTAYVFVGTTCPTTGMYVDRLKELEKSTAGKVDWIYLYPNRGDTSEAKLAFHKEKGLGGRVVDTQATEAAKAFGATKTAEVVLADAKGKIVYRGAIDDSKNPSAVKQRFVATAIQEHLAGKQVSTPKTDVNA